MADIDNFSSLDALGPSYGKINQPSLDEQGLSAFEGQSLSMPKIDFPQRDYLPLIPQSDNLNNQQINIRRNIVGEPPAPQPKGAGMSAKDFGKALGDYYEAKAGADQDYNEYARIYSYDAGPDGNNFYKRYSKWVSPERFSEIGFHPLRDNEAIYNSSATGWEGAKSMMMHSFWPMFKRAFVSGPKSLYNALQGDFSPDLDDARAQREASAIGASTRGGFTGFINNATMSFAYTAGIITEALVEEAAGFLLAAPTGGASVVATTANNARKIPTLLRGIKAIDKMGDGMKALNSTLKGLDNVNDARKFFNAAKVEKVTSNPLFRFANPLENITGAALKIAKNEDNLTGLARAYDIAKTGFGGFYGDVRAINMALSEARLEGGIIQDEVYDELYNNYYKEHGTAPSNEVQKDLLATAKEAGMTSLMWNSALIFASNKIVLDNIVGRRGGPRNFLKSKTEELLNLEGGNVIKNMKEVTLKTGKKVAKPELEWRQKSLWNTVKSFKDQPLNKSLKYGVGYFKANLMEGLQENSQEVISEATKAYYIDSFSNDNLATHQYARGLVTDAIKKQFSAQGFETFASGMVMGMFASPLNALPKAFSVGYNKIFDKEAYQKYKVARDSAGKNFVNSMSSVDIIDFFDNNLANYGMQSSAEDTRISAEEKQRRDASDGAFIMQMNTVMEKGMGDLYIQQLESLQGLTAEEIEEMVPSIPQGEGAKYLERLPETIDRAKRLVRKFNEVSERFPNPINPKSLDKSNPDYEEAAYTYKAWEVAKKNAIFFNEAFDNTLSRMASIQRDLATNGPIRNANAGDINVLFDQKLLENELDILKSEIDTLKSTDGNKTEIAQKQRKIDALKGISEKINEFRLQFVDRNRIARDLIQKNQGLSQEQLSELIDQVLGPKTEESDKKVSDELQTAFKDYLKVVADLSDDVVFDNSIESAFEKFRDFYLLNGEKRALVEAVNLLHDPAGFVEHVNRNKAWMKELYENRREYYENLKEQEFRKKEANDLLNHLASKGLYISYEDFIRWRDQNILPEEVYDDINKIVIKRSNPLYDELMQPFQMLSELQSKRTNLDIVNDSVKQELQELELETQKRLEALPRTEKRVDLGSLDFGKSKTIKIEAVKSQLEDGDYVDLTYTAPEGIVDTITLYKYEDELRFNNEDGNVFAENESLLLGTDSFSAAEKFRITNEPDPAEVDAIINEYNLKKAAILERAAEKGAVETVEKPEQVIYNSDTPLNNMPAELYNRLAILFDEYASENGMEDLIGDDYDMAFESFVRQDFMAARTIDEYNKEQNIAQSVTGVTPMVPNIVIAGEEYSLDDLPEKDIQGYLKGMTLELKNLEEKEDKTSEDNLRMSKLKLDIRTVNKYLSERKTREYTPEQKESIELLNSIVELQDSISKGPKGYIVNNQVLKRVTSLIRQFETEEYKYAAEGDVKATFNTTIGTQGFSQDSIDTFISELRKQKLPGFSDFTYKELQAELNNMLNESGSAGPLVKGVGIFNPSVGQVKREGGIIFGAAGKMNQRTERINQDALFVDQQKGLFIVADGMGGVNKVPFFQPHHAAKLMIDYFRGIEGKSPVNIIYDLYKANNNISVEEVFEKLKEEGYIAKESQIHPIGDTRQIAISTYLDIFKGVHKGKKDWLSDAVGAVGVKAQRIGANKYEIEHVGDAVFFIVDKNNKIRKAEGLSTSPFVDGFVWGLDTNDQVGVKPARRINKYQVELKPGERLVLSSDFIETKEAIQDFINSNFGESLNFDSFRKSHKNDDASFIVIEYGAESKIPEVKTTTPQVSNEDLLNKVINTISEKTYEESRLSGNYVDDQVRNVFDDIAPIYNEASIGKEPFDSLFSTDENAPGYITSIKNIIDSEGLYILSRVKLKDGTERGLVLFDEEAGVAGEVDLIAVDRAGNFFIIDIKTGKEVKWRGFNVEGNKSSKKEIYTLQQTAYANLLNNMIGKQAKISLLPIQVDYESNTGKITKAGRPTAKGALEEGKYRIPLIATEDIQAKIDSVIPRKVTEVPVAPEETPVENEDFETAAPDEDANIEVGPAEQIIDLDIETLREPIANATQEILDLFKTDFLNAIAQNNISAESVMAVQQLLDERQRELDSTTDVKLTSDNIKVGDELVAISSIFTDTAKTKVLIGEGETFVVESIDSDGESVKVRSLVKRLNPVPMSFAELNKMFKLKEEVMKPEVVEVSTAPLTKTEREFVEQSFENINDLLKDYARKDTLKKEADTQLTDDVDTELFDDVTSDC